MNDQPNHAAMLDLSSPRWQELLQAHGTAEDIPRLLEALAMIEGDRERAELWFAVWALLKPEQMVYSAAYAAVPHLLGITHSMALEERVAAMHFATAVETARHVQGAPPIPDDIVLSYATAIESLPQLVNEMTVAAWDSPTAQIMAAALLAGKRQAALSRAVLALGDTDA